MTVAAAPPAPRTATPRPRLVLAAWLARVVAIWALARAVTVVLFLLAIAGAAPQSHIQPHSSLWTVLGAWDGQWYQLIARQGYPTHLPIGPDGTVMTNAWAFLPAYPLLVRALTGARADLWPVAAPLVSLAFGFGCAVLLWLLLRRRIGERAALHGVAVFAFSPLSFVLQIAYAESMGLFLLLAALCLIDRDRFVPALAPMLLLAVTRPGVQALAPAVVLLMAVRIVRAVRGGPRVRVPVLVAAAVFAVAAFAAGFAWDGVAALVTRRHDAYVATELAWRSPWLGTDSFRPVVPWLWSAWFWFGRWGPAAFALLAGCGALVLTARRVRALGGTVVAWTAGWFLYLLAVFFPQSSVFRLALLPMAPLAGAVAPRNRAVLAVALLGGTLLQGAWIFATYAFTAAFWNVP